MNDLQLYELLNKQQQGRLTAAEEALLDQWYQELHTVPDRPYNVKKMKQRVWVAVRLQLGMKEGNIIPWRKYAVAAAMIGVIGVAIWCLHPLLHTYTSLRQEALIMKTIKVPHGSQARLLLADSSVVWLNGDAELDYPVAFGASRDVYLHRGEAFFEVAADAHKPFIVHSQHLHTEVLGTSFDIRNRGGQYMVAVATGKVKVYYQSGEKTVSISGMLKAGDRLTTDSIAGAVAVDSLDSYLYKGWTNKSYQLKDVSLAGVVFCMESIYGIHISIRNEELKKLRFTTSVSHSDQMEDILKRLSLAGGFKYKTGTPGTVIIY